MTPPRVAAAIPDHDLPMDVAHQSSQLGVPPSQVGVQPSQVGVQPPSQVEFAGKVDELPGPSGELRSGAAGEGTPASRVVAGSGPGAPAGRRGGVRERILEATLLALRTHGIGALTPTVIARLASIRQPNFYAHFKNLDHCLAAAAEHIHAQFVDFNRDAFAHLHRAVTEGRDFRAQNRAYHIELVRVLAEHRAISELVFRHRNGTSAFARTLRRLDRQTVAKVREHLWEWASLAGVSARHIDDISLLAEIHVGNVATVMLSLFDGVVADPVAAGEALATNAEATTIATLKRLRAAEPPAAPSA